MRVLGNTPSYQTVLLRDLKDEHYPYETEYKDFQEQPRWKQFHVMELHPLGMLLSVGKYYAYLNKLKGEWDFTDKVNNASLPAPPSEPHDNETEELGKAVKAFWQSLPRVNRVTLIHYGLVRFDSIALIDEKGDRLHECPHIFVDFNSERGPFSGAIRYLEIDQYRNESIEGLSRIAVFPLKFSKPSFGTIYKDRFVSVNEGTRQVLKLNSYNAEVTIYDVDEKYGYLKPTDVIGIEKTEDKSGKMILIKITSIRIVAGKKLLEACSGDPALKEVIESQISRTLKSEDSIRILEAIVIYDWQIEQNRPVV